MSIELVVIICIVSTVAGTISAGIRYYRSVLRKQKEEKKSR